MKKLFVVLALSFSAIACNRSENSKNKENIGLPSENIVGTWKITDYQNNILVPLSDGEHKGFESSVKLQRDKMLQLSEYTFNQNGSYHLQHSPTDFDKGQWLILNDSLMVQNSDIYKTSDTSIIHFQSKTEATILMSDATQSISVEMAKKTSTDKP